MTLSPTNYIWYNGNLVKLQDTKINPMTHGLHYGTGAFEGIRIYEGQPFKLIEHLHRLKASADVIGMKIEWDVEELCIVVQNLISKNQLQSGYIRPLIWLESDSMLLYSGKEKVNIMIAAWGVFEGKRDELRQRGMRLTISKWHKPGTNSIPHHAKTTGLYFMNHMMKQEAVQQGYDDCLVLDSENNITEATTSNIFLIINNELITPQIGCFLPGITRNTIIEIANFYDIKCTQRVVTLADLQKADAVFLTGTAIEIMPVAAIKESCYDINHPLLLTLNKAYKELTAAV